MRRFKSTQAFIIFINSPFTAFSESKHVTFKRNPVRLLLCLSLAMRWCWQCAATAASASASASAVSSMLKRTCSNNTDLHVVHAFFVLSSITRALTWWSSKGWNKDTNVTCSSKRAVAVTFNGVELCLDCDQAGHVYKVYIARTKYRLSQATPPPLTTRHTRHQPATLHLRGVAHGHTSPGHHNDPSAPRSRAASTNK